ncbi:MAG: FtsQ-type POTRA domain-containing protein [Pseudomonadota bacterium]
MRAATGRSGWRAGTGSEAGSPRLALAPEAGAFAARPRRHSPRRRLPLLLAAAVMLGAVVVALAVEGGRRGIALVPEADVLARRLGFGIEVVTLAGHRFAADEEILGALDLANVRSLVGFDVGAARRRIERIPWVASADITRVLPDRLDIRIVERKPFAVWQRGGKEMLIDATGRTLQEIGAGSVDHLPRVIGEGAAPEAATLVATVARHDEIARRFRAAERVGERRWTLRLSDGIVMHLPADGPALALERLAAAGRMERLLAQSNRIIDMRAAGRIAVRSAPAAESGVARVSGIMPSATGRKE